MTEKRLDNVIFSIYEIDNIKRGLDPHKAYCQDKISTRILKICVNHLQRMT